MYFVFGKFDSDSNHNYHYAKQKKLFWKLLATLQLLKKLKVLSLQLRVRRDQTETLLCGRSPSLESRSCQVVGARAGQGGTSSARWWPAPCWDTPWTYTAGDIDVGEGACLLFGNDLILKILQINWHFSFYYIYNDKLYRMHISIYKRMCSLALQILWFLVFALWS